MDYLAGMLLCKLKGSYIYGLKASVNDDSNNLNNARFII